MQRILNNQTKKLDKKSTHRKALQKAPQLKEGDLSPKRMHSKDQRTDSKSDSKNEPSSPSLFKEAMREQPLEEEAADEKQYKTINELKIGGYFGEIALMTKLKRTCSVFAINNVIVGTVSKEDFIQLTETSTDFKHRVFNKIAMYKDQMWKSLIVMLRNLGPMRNVPSLYLR